MAPPEIPRHDDGAEDSGLRHQVEHEADQLDRADHGDRVLRVSERHRALHRRRQPQQLHDGVEREKQRGERCQDVRGADAASGWNLASMRS